MVHCVSFCHQGIQNEKLRDEIFCQLANQTWKNDNEANCERGWQLMSHCLSAFAPTKLLYKYLLKYVSDNGQQVINDFLKLKLVNQLLIEKNVK